MKKSISADQSESVLSGNLLDTHVLLQIWEGELLFKLYSSSIVWLSSPSSKVKFGGTQRSLSFFNSISSCWYYFKNIPNNKTYMYVFVIFQKLKKETMRPIIALLLVLAGVRVETCGNLSLTSCSSFCASPLRGSAIRSVILTGKIADWACLDALPHIKVRNLIESNYIDETRIYISKNKNSSHSSNRFLKIPWWLLVRISQTIIFLFVFLHFRRLPYGAVLFASANPNGRSG